MHLTAIGLRPGPEYPPDLLVIFGNPVLISITMAGIVLIAVMPSAPARSTSFAMYAMSGTLGASLIKIGILVLDLTFFVTKAAISGSHAKGLPNSCSTLGQERFSSNSSHPD